MKQIRLPVLCILLCFTFLSACSQASSHVMEVDTYAPTNHSSTHGKNGSMSPTNLSQAKLSPSSSDLELEPETTPVPTVRPKHIQKPILAVVLKEETNYLPTPRPSMEPEPTESTAPTATPVATATPAPTPSATPTPEATPAPTEAAATPSPSPTAEATPSPEPVQKAGNRPMGVPESSPVKMSYFDDVLFIGDSNTWRFKNFVHSKRKSDSNYMGKATFLCKIGYGLSGAVSSSPIEDENDNECNIIEYIKEHSFNKIYIMLGTNDIGLGVDRAVNNYVELIGRIKKASNADIYIQSVLPMGKDKQKRVLNNANIEKFNKQMYEHSKSLNCYYLDVAYCLIDSEGNLPSKYSSDQYVHLSNAAFPLWADYLRTHTK